VKRAGVRIGGRVALIDYGMGNLRSVAKALERLGARVEVTGSPQGLRRAEALVLPGVGAFGEAATRLKRLGLFKRLREWIAGRRPFLGICLGLQLMFEKSEEFGSHRGLASFGGRVVPFRGRLRVPHMGWNRIFPSRGSRLFRGIGGRPYVYFVHTYYPVPRDGALVAARTRYGVNFACAIERGPVAGVQFHPEKSQRTGLRILRNFLEMAKAGA
jgi:glutamine amidotransferase